MSISNSIFNMFGRSPIRPLETHMTKAQQCALELVPFFEASLKEDWDTAGRVFEGICRIEKEADELKKDLRIHLPKGLFLPVPRSDILTLLTNQDRIANRAQDIAGLILGRRLKLPEAITEQYMVLLGLCLDTSKQALKAINELDELLESGFSGSEVKLVEGMIVELDRFEHASDEAQVDVRKSLFSIENTLNPIDVMFLYKVIELTGDLSDHAQTVGAQLQLMLAR